MHEVSTKKEMKKICLPSKNNVIFWHSLLLLNFHNAFRLDAQCVRFVVELPKMWFLSKLNVFVEMVRFDEEHNPIHSYDRIALIKTISHCSSTFEHRTPNCAIATTVFPRVRFFFALGSIVCIRLTMTNAFFVPVSRVHSKNLLAKSLFSCD